ncbi:MAG: LacI family DNA-binding transcriptional regulator [Spirochaetaceae bacterium]
MAGRVRQEGEIVSLATMKDVARRAGVSASTVSHIINNTRYVSADLTERVMQAIEELEYRPYGLARSLRTKHSHTLGVLIPDNTNPYFAEVARLLEDECFDRGYNVIICNTEQDPKKELIYLRLLTEKAADGIVFVSTGDDAEAIDALGRQRITSVLVDRDIPELDLDKVVSDNETGAYVATRHLLDLRHRRIACIAGPSGIASTEERLSGYRRAMEEAGLEGRVLYGDFQVESGYHAFRRLRAEGSLPTAVFASNDLMAMGVLHGAAEYGIAVPRELSVVGFDDIQLASYAVPSLTTVRQAKQRIVAEAVQLLLGRVDGEISGNARRRVLTPELVVRSSSGPPRDGHGADLCSGTGAREGESG